MLGRDVLHVSEMSPARVDGENVALKTMRGILRPKQCSYPLTISTSPSNPYGDRFGRFDILRYRYQGTGGRGRLTNTDNSDNRGLRELIRLRWPLVYFHGVESGRYLVVAPVVIVDDDPKTQTFGVCLGADLAAYEALAPAPGAASFAPPCEPPWRIDQRRYEGGVARLVRHNEFRQRVLAAYGFRCAVCRSGERELLEAARLAPPPGRTGRFAGGGTTLTDAGAAGASTGIAMCPSHHVAFDRLLIGITPSHEIRVRPDLLRARSTLGAGEPAGLRHVHGGRIHLPRDPANHPHAEALRSRFGDFEFNAKLNS